MAGRYNAAFAGKFTTPFVAEGCLSVWAQYALLAEDTKQRDRVIARLTEKGIPNMVYYPTPRTPCGVPGRTDLRRNVPECQ